MSVCRLLLVTLVIVATASAAWLGPGIAGQPAQVRVTDQSAQGVTLEITVPGINETIGRETGTP